MGLMANVAPGEKLETSHLIFPISYTVDSILYWKEDIKGGLQID